MRNQANNFQTEKIGILGNKVWCLGERHQTFRSTDCSWMNQVEQWFSILQRKRLRIADFADKKALAQRLQTFIAEWNVHAHPFNWTTKSVAKVMAKCVGSQPNLAKPA